MVRGNGEGFDFLFIMFKQGRIRAEPIEKDLWDDELLLDYLPTEMHKKPWD